MNPLLSTISLDAGYGKRAVVENLDVHVLRGQTICLIGPNGSGKSTVLRTLAGILAPVKGAVYLGQREIGRITPAEKAKQLALVLTERLNVNMTSAREIVALGRSPHTDFLGRLSPEDHRMVDEALETVGALDLGERNFTSLSDGEKQKVLIARALAQDPELVILDEPTSHLDIKHKIEVIQILNRLSRERGMTVIMALHDIDIAAKNCQTLLLVKNGKVLAQGKPEDIIGENTIGELYDIEGAAFDRVTGALEVCNEKAPEVFVAAGAGTGPSVYRILSRLGYGIATGILQENDMDYQVASSMRLYRISEKPFEPISRAAAEQARKKMEEAKFIIDCGFPLGKCNQVNRLLLGEAIAKGFPVISLRGSAETAELWGEAANLFSAASAAELCSRISDLGYAPGKGS
ncbi:MAG: ABC transporter ATP-binding protein [Treponema sp.]|jgi:iron complex transport system ATP-binding protein|nr:ABC transporter ATP-binding protein [Treponema sp.]